ncbi:deoxyribodipyrimidine photo-lyase [Cnuella takakiae]|uniref:Deoxyribodipyrimidine photo-lyase n=1 Tax=Cnuella takakiae TaxID=1302690 RepID=A0A1M5B409_9BACT|nr:FAD-binding domain-containing protein [Cnuella takakiae]SHF36922.1 deoxyribodipyrimidine photo-lyase [Cnuella takakiae]
MHRIDPVRYAKTRNFIDGDITYLSPYISRGVISLPQVGDAVLAKGYKPYEVEKFLQELAWREFFQKVWWQMGDRMFADIKQPQADVQHRRMIRSLADAQTGIEAIDEQIKGLYQTGYLHNHARMYIAGMACNLGRAHWQAPSEWMYYHLLDGDLASNTCSWQWVAGSFSSKKYIANQENINRYLHSNQRGTFLDCGYDTILDQDVPLAMQATTELQLETPLPAVQQLQLDDAKPLLLYNSYNLDPTWRQQDQANRVLVLEPEHFRQHPVSGKVLNFILALGQNIEGLQLWTGAVQDIPGIRQMKVYSRMHPVSAHYPGTKDPYPWMFPQVQGQFGSFFSFWKKAARYL